MSSESLLSPCLLLHARKVPPMASCVLVDHRCQWLPSVLSVKMVQVRCHRTANHLSVLTHAGIGSIDPFASVTTPNPCEFEARHSHSIPESYSEYHRQGLDFPDSQECCQWILAYTTKILIKESKRYSFNRR